LYIKDNKLGVNNSPANPVLLLEPPVKFIIAKPLWRELSFLLNILFLLSLKRLSALNSVK
jgi:hypothetical protein